MAEASAITGRRPAAKASVGGNHIMLLLFLVAVCVPAYFSIGTTLLNPIRVFLTVALVPMAIRLVTDRSLRLNMVDLMIVAYLGWSTLAIALSHPHRVVEWSGSLTIEVLGAYLVGRLFVRDRKSFIAFAKLIGLVVAATLPFAIMESRDGVAIIPDLIERLGLESVDDIDIGKRLEMERAQVIFAHPIHYGLFCSVAFSLTWVGLADEISHVRRVVVSAMVFVCCFLALSSGAFLAVIMQICLIGWYTMFRNVAARWKILFGLTALAYVAIDIVSESSPIRIFMRYATFSAHNAYWRATIFEWGMINVWSSPWIGIGLNNWVRPHWMPSASMDNYWLVQAVRTGIPAFVFLALAFLLPLWKMARRNFDGDPELNRLRRAYIFTVTGLIFSLATVHVWTNLQVYVYFVLGAGMWMLTVEPTDGAEWDPEPGPDRLRAHARAAVRPVYTRFPKGRDRPARPPAGVPVPAGRDGSRLTRR